MKFYSDVIRLLVFRQPLSVVELIKELNVPKQRLLRELSRLIKYNIVIRIDFESHVLYCINGKFNSIIQSVLNE